MDSHEIYPLKDLQISFTFVTIMIYRKQWFGCTEFLLTPITTNLKHSLDCQSFTMCCFLSLKKDIVHIMSIKRVKCCRICQLRKRSPPMDLAPFCAKWNQFKTSVWWCGFDGDDLFSCSDPFHHAKAHRTINYKQYFERRRMLRLSQIHVCWCPVPCFIHTHTHTRR